MNRFEYLSDLSLATVMKRLPRYNGRRALALASKRFIGVYKRNCAWIERADHLATRMKQLWRARTSPSHLLFIKDARQGLPYLLDTPTKVTLKMLQSLADEENNVDLAKLDFSALNFCTFEMPTVYCTQRAVMPYMADILRFVKFQFDKDTVERIEFVVGSFVLAQRAVACGETTCTMFLDFPTFPAIMLSTSFHIVKREDAQQTPFVRVRPFQSFSRALHNYWNYTYTNQKRWRGKARVTSIAVLETDKIVDHTPKSLQID